MPTGTAAGCRHAGRAGGRAGNARAWLMVAAAAGGWRPRGLGTPWAFTRPVPAHPAALRLQWVNAMPAYNGTPVLLGMNSGRYARHLDSLSQARGLWGVWWAMRDGRQSARSAHCNWGGMLPVPRAARWTWPGLARRLLSPGCRRA